MSDNVKKLSEARQKKGWTQKEVEEFARRRSLELGKISEETDEPDYLASGTQQSLEETCRDDDEDDQ